VPVLRKYFKLLLILLLGGFIHRSYKVLTDDEEVKDKIKNEDKVKDKVKNKDKSKNEDKVK